MSVSTMRSRLRPEDVQRLVKGADPEERAMSAHKICRRIAGGTLSEADRAAAEQILGFIMKDAAEQVRRAMAVTLKNSPNLPHDVAVRLAGDLDSIAAPVIRHSPVLTDDDLVRIVEAGSEAKQVSVGQRESVSSVVVRTIVEKAREAAVAVTAANDGAKFDRISYSKTLQRFGGSTAVTDGLIARAEIPVDIAEKLVSLVSDQALRRLASRHELPPQLAVELSESARERATIDLIDQAERSSDLRRFVQQLNLNARLTPSLVLRGACSGAMNFFEHALAELAGVPHQKAWMLVHDAGPLGLRAIFERAGLPERIYPAVRVAVDIYHDTDMEAGEGAREEFAQRIIQRVLTQRQTFAPEDLDYLLDRLDARDPESPLAAEAAQATIAA